MTQNKLNLHFLLYELRKTFLFNKPEISVYRKDNYEICCEIDMFNNHIMYFVREYKQENDHEYSCDYDYYSDYKDVIDDFVRRFQNAQSK